MRVSLSSLPSAPKEYVIDFPRLDGGLNLWELDYRMDSNQSPDMRNMCWRDGVLSCRDGQLWASEDDTLGEGYTCFSDLYWGNAFFHIGDALYRADAADQEAEKLVLKKLISGVPQNRGTFFRYGDALYYKNRGGYYKVEYNTSGTFSATPVVAYVPVTYINMEPTTAAGDEGQPENRLSPSQEVWYTTVSGVKEYQLPVKGLDSVDKVVVDGVELQAGADYTVDLTAGKVTFTTEPKHHDPIAVNTVRITFTKQNPDAYNSVMGCPYAAVYGGDQNVCVVLGGCDAQPNAYFWSGNHIVMDPGYFPFEHYNFAGDTEEAITGFGKQQAMLVIFKTRSIGRASFSTTTMASGRIMLEMPYTPINSRIGCDLPWTIQLVENNLVFCNTEQGVHYVRDSSSAYENNIVNITKNVNGTPQRPGLLAAVRKAKVTASFSDDNCYWVVSDGEAYVWDYVLSDYSKPSWFYYDNIGGVAFFRHNETGYHMDAKGRVSVFRRVFHDYGKPIRKVYQFATQTMGSYDQKKDILSVLFTVRSDTDTRMDVTYTTDYETRTDPTPIVSFSWNLAPRNLAYRFLGIRRYATVARRRPGCRNVRHFSMRLESAELSMDMSVVSAQIFYNYQGRER